MRKGRKPITLPAGILILLFTLMPLGGCQQQKGEFQSQLAIADSLMRTDADSAFRMLCGMDSLASRMPKSQRKEHLLLRCNAQNKADSLFTSDSLGLLLTRHFDRKGTPNQRMLAHYVLGCAYRDMGDSPSALRCFNEAVAAADTSDTNCNIRQLSIIYGQMGGIYSRQCLPNEALNAYDQAEFYAARSGDSLRIYNIWSNKSNAYFYQGNFEKGISLKEKAAEGLQNMGYIRYAAQTRGLCVEWLANNHQWDKAGRFMRDYVQNSGYFEPDGKAVPGHEGCYQIPLSYYLEKEEMDSARQCLLRWIPYAETTNERYALALKMCDYYAKLGQKDSVIRYSQQCLQLMDTLYSERSSSNYQRFHAQYAYNNYEKKVMEYKLESQQTQFWLFIYILFSLFCLVVMAIMGFIVYRWVKRRLHYFRFAHERDCEQIRIHKKLLHSYETEKLDMEEQMNKYSHTIDTLKAEIQQKTLQLAQSNNQLASEIQKEENFMELQAKLSQQEETIHELLQNCTVYQQQSEQLARIDRLKQLHDESCIKNIYELVRRNIRPTETDWSEIIGTVEKYYPQMVGIRLKEKISELEYRVCVLIKIRIELFGIMRLTGTNNSYLSTLRKRLFGKIQHAKGGAKDFDTYIQQL